MGQKKSVFSEEELQEYEDLTFFTKDEVLLAYKKFKSLSPEEVNQDKNAKLPLNKILDYPELSMNPYGDRICKVFSTSGDDSGDMTFEDFLDMMSVFSEACPKSVKTEYAFRIMDFDGDDMLGVSDLREIIDRLIGPDNHLNDHDMRDLIRCVLDEADLDDDGSISFPEFEHVTDKCRDFMSSFRINL